MNQDEPSEEWQKEIEHKLNNINKIIDLEKENGLRRKHKTRHPAEVFLTGLALIGFGMGTQNKAFTGIYTIGFFLSLVDLPRVLGKDASIMSKLLSAHTLYYVAGGLVASIYFTAIGHPFPGIELGLLASVTDAVIQLILQVV